MTPEARVKMHIKALLKCRGVYSHMPVQNGMGNPTLDFNGCYTGLYFAIEAKAPGKKPTPRQINTMRDIALAGGSVFLIDDPEGTDFDILRKWLNEPDIEVVSPSAQAALKNTGSPV